MSDLNEILELLHGAPVIMGQFQEPTKKVIEKLNEFGPDLKNLLSNIILALCDFKIAAIDKYEKAGFTRSQSILLTLDNFQNIKSVLDKSNNIRE